MASIVRNMDTGKSAVNRGNDYLPSWANATDDIAADGDKFAQEAGVQQTIVRVAKDSTNSLGLRRTSWSKASTGRLSGSKAAPTSDQFQGGQNQAFKQGRGENSLHGKVQKSTGIAKGTVARAKVSSGGGVAATSTKRKKISSELELVTTTNTDTRGRTFVVINTGKRGVQLELNFAGSNGLTVVGAGATKDEKIIATVPAGTEMEVGSIQLSTGRVSVKMALSAKTIVGGGGAAAAAGGGGGAVAAASSRPNRKASMPATKTRTAVATHAFDAGEDDECSLSKGDECTLLTTEDDGSGWSLVLNMTSGARGLAPTNHLDESGTPAAAVGSVNNVFRKTTNNGSRRGSWIGSSRGDQLPPEEEREKVIQQQQQQQRTVVRTTRAASIERNNTSEWNNESTNAKSVHVPSGQVGMVLGEADGIIILQTTDGKILQVPSKEVERLNARGRGGIDHVGDIVNKTTKRTITKKIIEKPAARRQSNQRVYLTERAIDGIRVNHVTGKVTKAKAKHPKQNQLDKFREKNIEKKAPPPPVPKRSSNKAPPPVPTKSWKSTK